ncbi:MAG: hypothetical protein RJA25_668 [Bacteroidota bacterium]|jgi:uncharacterized protein with HEPN domain
MLKDNSIYLEHMLQAIYKIEAYTKDVLYIDFVKNEEKQDAVIRKIEIIGEASKKISKEFKIEYSTIPWRAIAGMRDKLIHDYFEIDYETIWETVQTDIPPLKLFLEEIIHK